LLWVDSCAHVEQHLGRTVARLGKRRFLDRRDRDTPCFATGQVTLGDIGFCRGLAADQQAEAFQAGVPIDDGSAAWGWGFELVHGLLSQFDLGHLNPFE
jgi:hypothetical protein